jgi:hypothetical protein
VRTNEDSAILIGLNSYPGFNLSEQKHLEEPNMHSISNILRPFFDLKKLPLTDLLPFPCEDNSPEDLDPQSDPQDIWDGRCPVSETDKDSESTEEDAELKRILDSLKGMRSGLRNPSPTPLINLEHFKKQLPGPKLPDLGLKQWAEENPNPRPIMHIPFEIPRKIFR